MKKQLLSLILSGLFLFTLQLVGQNADYPVKKINGVEHYIYTVQPHEGMYAISRKFGIKQADINKANPEMEDGLKAGQQILIPVQNSKIQREKPVVEKEKDNASPQPAPEFIIHKVKNKQTLFAICRKYNVTEEDVKKYNPEVENGLREGITLRIPKPVEKVKPGKENKTNDKKSTEPEKKGNSKKQPAGKKNTTVHIVQPGETLYSISKKYNVEVEDIVRLNPGSDTKITAGSELKIPTDGKTDYLNNIPGEPAIEKQPVRPIQPSNKKIKIAFLLPFMLENGKSEGSTERFFDFYGGAIIAASEAKKKGISLEIFTYDTEKSEEKLNEILANPEIKNMDLIIGPAFSNQISVMGNFAKENKINTLIPFTSKVYDIENNPYLFQFNPGVDAETQFAIELLGGKMKNFNLVFADIAGVSSFDEGKTFSDGLKNFLAKSNRAYSELKLVTSDNADFSGSLKKGVRNLVIFNTDKFAYVSPFIDPLRTQAREFNVVMYKQYNWINQTNKIAQNLYISPFISNLDQNELVSFNSQFTAFFNREASKDLPRFDLLGYDLTSCFIHLISRYGSRFTEKSDT
ncbi:MAG TPA: LysM peptidoglycan-binding domain-containing protein, partial [Paludibacter sp.]|nr:LysM peptidoglycan-binding domain-containing protein [Paludibacter sp.]